MESDGGGMEETAGGELTREKDESLIHFSVQHGTPYCLFPVINSIAQFRPRLSFGRPKGTTRSISAAVTLRIRRRNNVSLLLFSYELFFTSIDISLAS